MSRVPTRAQAARSERGANESHIGMTEFFADAYDACEHCVQRNPGASILLTLGAGFGIGLLIGHVLGEPPRDERSRAAKLGQQALDAMSRILPDQLQGRLRG